MSYFGAWLLRQWSKSNLVSGLLALAVWGTICGLAIAGKDIPAILATAGGAIIMFFYKSKTGADGGE